MNIKIQETKRNHFIADLLDLPGSPPIGEGGTEAKAIANLFFRLTFEGEKWIKYIDHSEFIINGETIWIEEEG